MHRMLPAFFCMWTGGCGNEPSGTPFRPSSLPEAGVPPADVVPQTPNTVTRPDLSAVADMAVTIDMAVPDLATATPDLAESGPDLGRNPAGPWPTADLTIHSGVTGLIDAGPDEAQNIWAATRDALYLLQPGQTKWVKYTAADGLHIQSFTDPWGNASVTRITALAAGAANQVFVGYYGYESDVTRDTDPQSLSSLGWADRVQLGTDGKLTTVHYAFHCDRSPGIVEDRSVRRMLYAHDGAAAGHLFLGMDHGVVHIFEDMAGDHVHPEVNYLNPDGGTILKIGENFGLALRPDGALWIGGGYGVGLQPWNPVPHFDWVDAHFLEAFTVYTGNHGLSVPYGYREDQRGVAVTSDGTVWFASLTHGLWSYDGTPNNYTSTRAWPSVPSGLMDLAADPDGTLWIVTDGGQLLRFDPSTDRYQTWHGVSDVRRIVMDTTVIPRALYVSMGSGLAVIRAK
jgi:hypothetical protein